MVKPKPSVNGIQGIKNVDFLQEVIVAAEPRDFFESTDHQYGYHYDKQLSKINEICLICLNVYKTGQDIGSFQCSWTFFFKKNNSHC